MAAKSDLDALIRRKSGLMAEGRRLVAARRDVRTPPTPDERRVALALASSLSCVVAALKRHAEDQGRDFQDHSHRNTACLAYLKVGHLLHTSRR